MAGSGSFKMQMLILFGDADFFLGSHQEFGFGDLALPRQL
jgi:hypothetical protein